MQVSGEQLDQSHAQSCPLCKVPLVQAAIAKTPLLFCTQCRGLLLPMNVLPELIDQLRASPDQQAIQIPPDRADLQRTIQCPLCQHRMDTHLYAGPGNVVIDSCEECNLIWLDRGELTRIAHARDGDTPSEDSTSWDTDSQQGDSWNG